MNNVVKVLHYGLDTHLGGIETYLLSACKNIDREKYSFSFLAFDDEKPCFYEELTNLGCSFYFIRSRRKSFLENKKDLYNLFQNEHFDIIHCNLNSLTYITPIFIALRLGVKVIAHSHNAGSSGSSSRLLCTINKFRFPYNKVLLVAVSDKAGAWMFGKKKKVITINNGVDTQHFRFSIGKRKKCREVLGFSDEQEVILHVGAFRKQKNHSFVIDIFKDYKKKNPNSVLLLVGDGELKTDIQNKAIKLGLEDSVFFLGTRYDLDSIFSASDKFIFPSLYEGFPIALLEAECSGLLCIVSNEITEQVCLKNSIRVGLNESICNWVHALELKTLENRVSFSNYVADCGFDVKSETQKLENLYDRLCEITHE